MCNQLVSYLSTKNILYQHQYGFRTGHSTVHPILHLLNHISHANDSLPAQITLALFLDLSKAFDTISHDILLKKLDFYGIRDIANQWFRNYLSDRKQYVQIGNASSVPVDISLGVPQGSILGPVLFLIYVNDIQYASKGNILSFADDTTLYMSDSNISSLFTAANRELEHLFNWFCANHLSLNAKKSKYTVAQNAV